MSGVYKKPCTHFGPVWNDYWTYLEFALQKETPRPKPLLSLHFNTGQPSL